MASKPVDLESQKPVPPAVVAAAATAAPAASSAEKPPGASTEAAVCEQHDAPETQPLLVPSATAASTNGMGGGADGGSDEATRLERAMAGTFRSVAELAKHLPTGAVLIFEVLSPVFTNGGSCDDTSRVMVAWLVAFCALTCFFLCFTDSFQDERGKIRYGVATQSGLWVIDGTPPPADAINYQLKFIDFLHAFLSLIVFMSVAMFDRNVESCFYPVMSSKMRQVMAAVPLAGGVVGTLVFARFPSTRRGIGFPRAVP